MTYCPACGTELPQEAYFCPECGTEIESGATGQEQDHEPATDTAPCRKCGTDIPTNVNRCPQCGYEPSSEGVLSSIFGIICILWLGLGALLYLGAFTALFTGGYTISGFFGGITLITAFIMIPAGYLYGMSKKANMQPTDKIEILGQEVQ